MAAKRRAWPLVDAVLGLVIAGGGSFLLLSLLSLGLGAAAPSANWGGPVGEFVARACVQALGSAAPLTVILFWHAALLCCRHAPRRQRLLMGGGGALSLLGVSVVGHLTLAHDPFFRGDAGGLAGHLAARLLVPYCNRGGTLLIAALCLALSALLLRQSRSPAGRDRASWGQRLWTMVLKRWLARSRDGAPPRPRRRRAPVPRLPAVGVAPGVGGRESAPRLIAPSPPLAAASTTTAPAASATPGTAAYTKPALALFAPPPLSKQRGHGVAWLKQAKLLEAKLHDFGIAGHVVQVLPGPVVTMYEFEPASGIKVSRIVNLADDLALGMKALSVRIVAPVPGKAVVGIEIPNAYRAPVVLGEILAAPAFQHAASPLVLALGKDILGTPTVTDLAQIPHLLIAGATGSGKSVGLNSMICSILQRATPEEVKFIMIDPKMLELSVYDGIPHLITPVVTHPKKAAAALHWAVEEMERRYRLLAEQGVRGIDGYNQRHADQPLPYIVVVIDELADLMLVARRDVEDALTRLAQMARAAGIHLLVATQRPSVDVLTGIIKANFPARISFQVSSRTDSRTILDAIGAERLLGKGDMLFLPPGTSALQRIHGAFVSEAEIARLVAHLRAQQAPVYDASIVAGGPETAPDGDDHDAKYDEAVALVARLGQASASLIQRHLRVGYNRAARLLAAMERDGVVGPADGSRPREVFAKAISDLPFR